MKNKSLTFKIAIGFGLLVVLQVFTGTLMLWRLQGVRVETQKISDVDMTTVRLARSIQESTTAFLASLNRSTLTLEPQDATKTRELFEALAQSVLTVENNVVITHSPSMRGYMTQITAKLPELGGIKGADGSTTNSALQSMSVGIDGMRDQRQTLLETEETFFTYLRKIASLQQEALKNREGDPVQIMARLSLIDEILAEATEVGHLADKGYSERQTKLIEQSVEKFAPIVVKMDKLLEITPTTRAVNPASPNEVVLARKDDLSNARSQASLCQSFLKNFLLAWKEMEAARLHCVNVASELEKLTAQMSDKAADDTGLRVNQAAHSTGVVMGTVLIVLPLTVVIGVLLSIFFPKSIIGPVNQVINELNDGANRSSEAADQVAKVSQTLAEQTQEQAAAVEATESAIEEIGSTSRQNTNEAQRAKELAQHAQDSAHDGHQDVQHMVRAVEMISVSFHELRESITAIATSNAEVAEIMRTIDEIAFQTNIIAINASIEAAAAGQMGVGFAVVADEVRSLAHRSAEAAEQTTLKVASSLERSNRSAALSEKVVQNLRNVISHTRYVEKKLDTITFKTKEVNEAMTGIVHQSQDQLLGVQNIARSIEEIDAAMHNNSASAESSAHATEKLDQQVEALRQQMSVLDLLLTGSAAQSGLNATKTTTRLTRPVLMGHRTQKIINQIATS